MFFSHWSLLCTLILKTKPNKVLNENEEIIIPTLNLEVVYISINHLDVSLTIVNLAHWLKIENVVQFLVLVGNAFIKEIDSKFQ